tara:strand:+ start:1807 stop:2241 length:435 start_codon:yes stop_codon:yes gene_type:complete
MALKKSSTEALTSQREYEWILEKIGITDENIRLVIESEWFNRNAGALIEEETDTYEKRPSPIEGVGVYAKVKFNKGDVIGYGKKDGVRSMLGRYINHSPFKNAMFYFEGDDIILATEQDILPGDEILVDYTDHTFYNHKWTQKK